ncbi:MAG: DMT family transporter [Rhodospirillales bacterium]|nr:MAG: DMT family transporter [Rhodospirillales bacterium]
MSSLDRRDTLLALAVILIWGAHFAVIKAGVTQLGPFVSLTLRFGLTALAFAPFARWPGWPVFRRMAIVGVLMGVIHQGLLFAALGRLDSASVAVLMQSQTIFAVLMGWMILRERFGWRTALGLGVGALGLVVMLGVPDVAASLGGFALAMASSLVLSYAYIRMRQLSHVHGPTLIAVLNGVSFPFALLASFTLAAGDRGWAHAPAADWRIVGFVLAYQVGLVSFSHSLWQKLLARNEVARVTCYTLLMPPIAIAVGVIFMGTPLTRQLFEGAGLILAGLGIVVLRRVQKHRNAPLAAVE